MRISRDSQVVKRDYFHLISSGTHRVYRVIQSLFTVYTHFLCYTRAQGVGLISDYYIIMCTIIIISRHPRGHSPAQFFPPRVAPVTRGRKSRSGFDFFFFVVVVTSYTVCGFYTRDVPDTRFSFRKTSSRTHNSAGRASFWPAHARTHACVSAILTFSPPVGTYL